MKIHWLKALAVKDYPPRCVFRVESGSAPWMLDDGDIVLANAVLGGYLLLGDFIELELGAPL